jgi:hypothetical protein
VRVARNLAHAIDYLSQSIQARTRTKPTARRLIERTRTTMFSTSVDGSYLVPRCSIHFVEYPSTSHTYGRISKAVVDSTNLHPTREGRAVERTADDDVMPFVRVQ